VEENFGVDYRFLKTFRGDVINRHERITKDVDFYVRYFDFKVIPNE